MNCRAFSAVVILAAVVAGGCKSYKDPPAAPSTQPPPGTGGPPPAPPAASAFSAQIRMVDPQINWGVTGRLQVLDGPAAGQVHQMSGYFGTFVAVGSLYLPSTIRLSAEGYAPRDFVLSVDNGRLRNPFSTILDFEIPMQFNAGSGDTRVSKLPGRPDEFVFDRFRAASAGAVTLRTWWGDGDPRESAELRLELWCEGALLHAETQRFFSAGRTSIVNASRGGDCEVRLWPWRNTANRMYRIDLQYPR